MKEEHTRKQQAALEEARVLSETLSEQGKPREAARLDTLLVIEQFRAIDSPESHKRHHVPYSNPN